jgi:hypothetical protein
MLPPAFLCARADCTINDTQYAFGISGHPAGLVRN